MGGKGSGGARKKVRPDDKRQQNAGPPATTLDDQRLSPLARLAIDLGYSGRAALLAALGERYNEQPGLVRNALREALFTADERRVVAAAVEEMLAERDALPARIL